MDSADSENESAQLPVAEDAVSSPAVGDKLVCSEEELGSSSAEHSPDDGPNIDYQPKQVSGKQQHDDVGCLCLFSWHPNSLHIQSNTNLNSSKID